MTTTSGPRNSPDTKRARFVIYYRSMETHEVIPSTFLSFALGVCLLLATFATINPSSFPASSNCPLATGHSIAICQANPLEHIGEWQNAFVAQPVQGALLFLFALLTFLAVCGIKASGRTLVLATPLTPSRSRLALARNFQIFDPLREGFSRGILHPKLF